MKTAERSFTRSFTTISGVPIEPVYGPDEGEFPGVYPYTRGPYASMYRSKLWTMRMFAGYGLATETNRRFRDMRLGIDLPKARATAFTVLVLSIGITLVVGVLLW